MFKQFIAALSVCAIALVAPLADAGVIGGARSAHAVVGGGGTHSYQFPLYAGEMTYISVSGDGDSDLDCYLLDDNGNEVDRDDDNTDECRIVVRPRWAATFRLVIRNRGVANEYTLRTN